MADTASSNPTPNPAPTTGNKGRRWLIIALTASVALNLAVIGWAGARFYKHREWAAAPFGQIERRVARHLPPAAADAFRAEIAKVGETGPSFGPVRRELSEALGAEPYDPAKLAAAMTARRQQLERFHTAMQNGLLAAANAMTPAERKEYAEKLAKFGKHMDRDHRRDRRD